MVPFPPPPPPATVIHAAVEDLKAAPHVDPAVKVAVAAVAEKTVETAAKLDAMGKWNQFLTTPIGQAVGLLILAVLGLATAYFIDLAARIRTPAAVVAPETKKEK